MYKKGKTTQSLNTSRRSGGTKKDVKQKQKIDLIRIEQAVNFINILEYCGVTISQLSYGINCDVTSFTRSFTLKLSSTQITMDTLHDEIEYHIGTQDRLKASMEPLEYSGPPEYSLSNMGQPTLMRLLLDISSIQPFIISLLLAKLEGIATVSDQGEVSEVTNLILSQLRWISKLVKPREFSSKILKVLNSSPLPLKRLIVLCLPDIVEDSEHTFVAQQLKELLSDINLTAVIIDTTSNFHLSPDLMEDFKESALSMLTSVPSDDLKYLLKFILHPSHQEESDEVVTQVRCSDIFKTTREPQRNVVIISTLESVLRFQPLIFESWLKYIELSPSQDVRPVDLCVLCIMYSSSCAQLRVQNALKAKLKQGISIEPILEDLSILTHCFSRDSNSFFALFQSSLISNESSFSLDLIRSLFLEVNSEGKQSIIDFILQTLCLDPQSTTMLPLSLLISLAESDRDMLLPFAPQLQALYPEIYTFSQKNIIKFFELTTCLALKSDDPGDYYIDDTFHEAVNTLLSNGDKFTRNVGVVGMSVGIRLLLEKLPTNVNDSQLRRLTKPILLLKQILSPHPASLAIFYSELAAIMGSAQRNEKFLRWVMSGLEKEFKTEFMMELSKKKFDPIGELKPCLILGLNNKKPQVALKLLQIVSTLHTNKLDRTRDSRCLFSLLPQLRLVSICCQHLNGSLQQIEYILTSPIVLIQQDELAKPNQFSSESSHLIASSLLLLSAWLCELMNIYSTAKEGLAQSPIYQCLSQLILVETLLNKYATQLSSLPKYITQSLLQAVSTTYTDQGSYKQNFLLFEKVKSGSDKQQVSFVSTPLYEQISLHSLMLIKNDVNIEKLSKTTSDEFWNKFPVNLHECTFLFRALRHKLDKLTPTKLFGQPNKKLNYDNEVFTMVCELFPYICCYLELIDKTPDNSMDISESDFFQTQNELDFISLLLSCLETIFHIISQSGDAEKFDLIFKTISTFFQQNADQVLLGKDELVVNAIAYFDSILFRGDIFTFVPPICKIYTHISILHDKPRIRQNISQSLGKILKHEWPHYGGNKPSLLEDIVKFYVNFHESPLLAIEEIAGTAITELLYEDTTKSNLFPTLNSSTVYTFYKVLFTELVNDLKSLQERPFQPSDSMDLQLERLFKLEVSVRLFSILVTIVKSFDTRFFLATTLKLSRYYIDSFLKLAMPLLDFLFRDKNNEITALLKSLQQGTRCLQHYCTHSKKLKNVSLTRYVPPLKKSLEMFVFRVKAMLGVNNCRDAFTIGNLKNKNLQGDVIESQSLDESLDSIRTDL